MPSVLEVEFVAPVPRGHEVHVITLTHDELGRTAQLVHDRTAGVVYGGTVTAGPLARDVAFACADPASHLARFSWKVTQRDVGVAQGALVTTSNHGEVNVAVTRLVLEPGPASPYRG